MGDHSITSRRALLAAAAGGAAALTARAVASPAVALGADGGPLTLGAANTATSPTSLSAAPTTGATLSVLDGDPSGAATSTAYTGVYAYSEASPTDTPAAGLWGDSGDYGVYGSGSTGVYGDGGTSGTGLYGVSETGFGLDVSGRVRLSTRSGRFTVAAGKTSAARSVAGMAAANIVIAVLQTSESGVWVRAAVPAAGKFTVYFNKALTSSAVIGWLVLG